MSDGWNHAGRSGAEYPLQEGGQQWLEVSLAFGMNGKKKSTGTQREIGGRYGQETDTEHVCRGKGDRESMYERLRTRETKAEPRIRWNHSDREERFRVRATQRRPRQCYRDRDPWRGHRRLSKREVRRGLLGELGGGTRGREEAWGPWAAAACLDPGAHSEGQCGLPHLGWQGSPALRGPGAPWSRTARLGCGRAAPSRPAALRGPGRRRPQSPES